MNEIEYVIGDATVPHGSGKRMIAHVCNDAGGWGAGFVLALSRRWPQPERAYRTWFRGRENNDFALGAIQVVQVADDLSVVNMVAQHGIRARTRSDVPIRYNALRACLATLHNEAARRGASIHMPRIGSGLAGGDWGRISRLIQEWLVAPGIAVTVYDLERKAADAG
ncbi:Appr-1-p processing protein [Nonomuraea fuscirosea]